jgi:cyclase
MDADGTRRGYDLPLTRSVSDTVGIPVIASGGAGNLQQVLEAVKTGHADAVLLASLLHYNEYRISDIKAYLHDHGVLVR